ncbi:MAG: bacteriohemerythrin [Terracidiphilus sp.]
MPLLTWSSKYSVGVKALDDQHASFIAILNELHAAMLKGQAQDITGPMLNKLMDYTREHFATEERLMESTKYPGLADQRVKHREFTGKIEDYVSRFKRGEGGLYLELLKFARDWITEHMQTVDKRYTAWMNERGVH